MTRRVSGRWGGGCRPTVAGVTVQLPAEVERETRFYAGWPRTGDEAPRRRTGVVGARRRNGAAVGSLFGPLWVSQDEVGDNRGGAAIRPKPLGSAV